MKKNDWIILGSVIFVAVLVVGLGLYVRNLDKQLNVFAGELSGFGNKLETIDSRLEKVEIDNVTLQKQGYVEKPGLTVSANQILPSVVFILNPNSTSSPTSYDNGNNVIISNVNDSVRGTGFFISSNGYIATAKHVIADLNPNSVMVMDSGHKIYNATVFSTSSNADIAVLKIQGNSFIPVVLGHFENINVGDAIGVLGYNPGFNSPLIAEGSVSSKGLDDQQNEIFTINSFVNPGNSGSPVFSQLTGRVIGIVSAKQSAVTGMQPIDISKVSSGISFGGTDPAKQSAELYNEMLQMTKETSQVGIGIIYSTDAIPTITN